MRSTLGLLGVTGLMPLDANTEDATYAGTEVAWWVPLVLLGLVTAAVAYVTGIAAIRRLGSRVASFVALTEVVAGVVWAWLLLDELPRPIQLLGGVLILAGVIAVKLGEKATASRSLCLPESLRWSGWRSLVEQRERGTSDRVVETAVAGFACRLGGLDNGLA